MRMDEVIAAIFPINCRYNLKIEDDGFCYSTKCMMNVHDELKEKIAAQGCRCFRHPEVQALLPEEEREDAVAPDPLEHQH